MSVRQDRDEGGVLGLLRSSDRLFGIDTSALTELAPIGTLDPFLSGLPEVLGAITLRGTVIPVLDPVALCGLPPRNTPPRSAAVVWNETSMVALAIDDIVELRRYKPDELQKIESSSAHPVLQGHLPLAAGTANILDVDRLFGLPDIPRAPRSRRAWVKKDQRGLIPHLTFESGGITYAVDVKNIFNTVPRRPIENTDIASGPFLGNITYLQRRIPVVETNMVMKMDAPRHNTLPEIVVLRMDEKRLLGLAVDQILRIAYFEQTRLPPLQDHLRSSAPLIKATLSEATSDSPILVLDADAMKSVPALHELAELSRDTGASRPAGPAAVAEEGSVPANVIREQVRNLLFFTDREMATPVQAILNIIAAPRAVIPWQGQVRGVIGLFSFEGTMVPLLDLAAHLGAEASGDTRDKRVLITGDEDRKIGFLVNRVTGISTSNWRAKPEMQAPEAFDAIQIQEWPKNRIVARIDLGAVSRAVSAQFSHTAARMPAELACG